MLWQILENSVTMPNHRMSSNVHFNIIRLLFNISILNLSATPFLQKIGVLIWTSLHSCMKPNSCIAIIFSIVSLCTSKSALADYVKFGERTIKRAEFMLRIKILLLWWKLWVKFYSPDCKHFSAHAHCRKSRKTWTRMSLI